MPAAMRLWNLIEEAGVKGSDRSQLWQRSGGDFGLRKTEGYTP